MSLIGNKSALVRAMSPVRRQAITWINADPVHWRIYAALGGDELNWLDQFSGTNVIGLVSWPHVMQAMT